MVMINYRQIVKSESLPNFSLTHNINISDVCTLCDSLTYKAQTWMGKMCATTAILQINLKLARITRSMYFCG